MSNVDLFSNSSSPKPNPSGHRPSKKSFGKKLLILIAAVAIVGLLASKVISQFSGSPDFPGPGNGSIQVQIEPGQNLAQIGNNLKALGIVESVDGFIAAAKDNPNSATISPGAYNLLLEMKSSDAILALLDPANRVVTKVVIPEGKRETWTINTLSTQTGLPITDFEAAIANAANLGLPDYAAGNPEGFLFPATYEFAPGTTDDCKKLVTQLFREPGAVLGAYRAARKQFQTGDIVLVVNGQPVVIPRPATATATTAATTTAAAAATTADQPFPLGAMVTSLLDRVGERRDVLFLRPTGGSGGGRSSGCSGRARIRHHVARPGPQRRTYVCASVGTSSSSEFSSIPLLFTLDL
jgi:hypothetical protein